MIGKMILYALLVYVFVAALSYAFDFIGLLLREHIGYIPFFDSLESYEEARERALQAGCQPLSIRTDRKFIIFYIYQILAESTAMILYFKNVKILTKFGDKLLLGVVFQAVSLFGSFLFIWAYEIDISDSCITLSQGLQCMTTIALPFIIGWFYRKHASAA